MMLPALYPWHKPHWQLLKQQYQAGRLPHALLLESPPGLGAHDFACAFIHYLFCINTTPLSDQPCGHCSACQLLQYQSHPDWHTVLSEDNAKTGHSVSIKIDDIRAMTARLHETPQQGRWRVVLIDPADTMTQEASNALLKTLEEPGDHVLMILLTQQSHRLLPTLRSRCQVIKFCPPSSEIAHHWLSMAIQPHNNPEITAQPDLLKGLLALHDDAPLTALEALKNNDLALFKELLGALVKTYDGLLCPTELAKQCLDHHTQKTLNYLYKIIQSFILQQHGLSTPLDYFPLKPKFKVRLNHLVSTYTTEQWHQRLESVMITKERFQCHTGLDKQLQLEALFETIQNGQCRSNTY